MTENNLTTLGISPLFTDIEKSGVEALLQCLHAKTKKIRKNEIVLLAGERPRFVGLLLSGRMHIVKDDYKGNRALISVVSPGEIFAEAFCYAGVEESPVSVIAESDAEILLLRFDRVIHTCPNTCGFHTKLIENIIGIIAKKNLMLQTRLSIVSNHSIREKVLLYLNSFNVPPGKEFTIPFNRERLSEYLCTERSALSHELAKMQKEKLIFYKKNIFILLNKQEN